MTPKPCWNNGKYVFWSAENNWSSWTVNQTVRIHVDSLQEFNSFSWFWCTLMSKLFVGTGSKSKQLDVCQIEAKLSPSLVVSLSSCANFLKNGVWMYVQALIERIKAQSIGNQKREASFICSYYFLTWQFNLKCTFSRQTTYFAASKSQRFFCYCFLISVLDIIVLVSSTPCYCIWNTKKCNGLLQQHFLFASAIIQQYNQLLALYQIGMWKTNTFECRARIDKMQWSISCCLLEQDLFEKKLKKL